MENGVVNISYFFFFLLWVWWLAIFVLFFVAFLAFTILGYDISFSLFPNTHSWTACTDLSLHLEVTSFSFLTAAF